MARRPRLWSVPNCGSKLMDDSTSSGRPEIRPQLMLRNRPVRRALDLQGALRRDLLIGVDPLPNGSLSDTNRASKGGLGNALLPKVGFQLHRPILATLVRDCNSALLDSAKPSPHRPRMNGLKRPKPGEGVPLETKRKEGKALAALWKEHRKRTGRTQEEFAEEQGFGQGNFSHYVGGRRPIPLDVGVALAKEMKCALDDFSPRLAAELAAMENQRLAPWPFNNVHPDRVADLSPGKRLQLEGILLEELDRIEGGTAGAASSNAKAP